MLLLTRFFWLLRRIWEGGVSEEEGVRGTARLHSRAQRASPVCLLVKNQNAGSRCLNTTVSGSEKGSGVPVCVRTRRS